MVLLLFEKEGTSGSIFYSLCYDTVLDWGLKYLPYSKPDLPLGYRGLHSTFKTWLIKQEKIYRILHELSSNHTFW